MIDGIFNMTPALAVFITVGGGILVSIGLILLIRGSDD